MNPEKRKKKKKKKKVLKPKTQQNFDSDEEMKKFRAKSIANKQKPPIIKLGSVNSEKEESH